MFTTQTPADWEAQRLKTAVETVLASNPKDETPKTTVLVRSAREGNNIFRLPSDTPQALDLVKWEIEIGDDDKPLCSDTVIGALKEIEAKMAKLHADRATYGPGMVAKEVQRQLSALEAKQLAGESIADCHCDSFEHVAKTFNARAEAIRKHLVRICKTEVEPLVRPILETFETRLIAHLRQLETKDIELCALYGVSYEPSISWKMAAAVFLAHNRNQLPKEDRYEMPSRILAGLVDFQKVIATDASAEEIASAPATATTGGAQ